MSNSINFEIIAGTYEEYLLGYFFSSKENSLVQSVASHDHSSSVRCLTSSGNYLASGAADDRIIIYDLKARKEHCMLSHHESTVTSVSFTNNHSHIISGSQDGALAIVRVGNWQLEKIWEKAHKGASILDIALHSSGKLALTLGSDSTIRTWNLIKGRPAYIINLNSKCQDSKSLQGVIFAPDNVKFVLYGGKYTEIWSIEVGGVLKVLKHEEKVTCCTWLNTNTLFVGYEGGIISIWDLESENVKISKQGHNGRIKATQYYQGFIVTTSSTGQIKVWTRKLKEVASVETGCRITCLNIVQWSGILKKDETEENNEDEILQEQQLRKSTVVIEVDDSTDEEIKIIKTNKKRKKKPNCTTEDRNSQNKEIPSKMKKLKNIETKIENDLTTVEKIKPHKKQSKRKVKFIESHR